MCGQVKRGTWAAEGVTEEGQRLLKWPRNGKQINSKAISFQNEKKKTPSEDKSSTTEGPTLAALTLAVT